MREGEEKQRRAREAREKAEVERAARAARKRALVDMNAHETQEGVMDSLMEALQTGSAFSRPDQRRKRQTRVAGGKSKSLGKKILWWSRSNSRDSPSELINNTFPPSVTNPSTFINNYNHNINININLSPINPPEAPVLNNCFTTPSDNEQKRSSLLLEAMRTPKPDKLFQRISKFKKLRKKIKTATSPRVRPDLLSPIFGITPQRSNFGYNNIRKHFKTKKTMRDSNKNNINVSAEIEPVGKGSSNVKRHIPKILINDQVIGAKEQATHTPYDLVINELKMRNELKRSEEIHRSKYSPINAATRSKYFSLYKETLVSEARRVTPAKQSPVSLSTTKFNRVRSRSSVGRYSKRNYKLKDKPRRLNSYLTLASPLGLNLSIPDVDNYLTPKVTKSCASPRRLRVDTTVRSKSSFNLSGGSEDNLEIDDDVFLSAEDTIGSDKCVPSVDHSGGKRWKKFWKSNNSNVSLTKYNKSRMSDSDVIVSVKDIVKQINSYSESK